MTVFAEMFGSLSVIGTATFVAIFGSKTHKAIKEIEQALLDTEVERDVANRELDAARDSLFSAEEQVEQSLAKQEKLASEISEVSNLASDLMLEKESSRKALSVEVETRVGFQNEAHALKCELESLRLQHENLQGKHTRFLTTRDQIVSDLGRAQLKLEEWQDRWDAHQRMVTENPTGAYLKKQVKELEYRCRLLNDEIDGLRHSSPVRASNGRFAKKHVAR